MSVLMFLPKKRASPDVGGRRPINIEIVVLLPAPLCPVKKRIHFKNTTQMTFLLHHLRLNSIKCTLQIGWFHKKIFHEKMNHEKNTQYTALYIRSAIHVPYASKACLIQQSSRKITKSTKVNKRLFNQYNLSSK